MSNIVELIFVILVIMSTFFNSLARYNRMPVIFYLTVHNLKFARVLVTQCFIQANFSFHMKKIFAEQLLFYDASVKGV